MKKLIHTLLLVFSFALLPVLLMGQSIKMINPTTPEVEIKGTPDQDVKYIHTVQNNTAGPIQMLIKSSAVEITPGHRYFFCDYVNCYPDTDGDFSTKYPNNLAAGEITDNNFYVDLKTANTNGTSRVKFKFYIKDNESDYVEYIAKFVIGNVSAEETTAPVAFSILNNEVSDVLSVFSGVALSNATLDIYDYLGNKVMTKEISGNTSIVGVSELSEGMYFGNLREGAKTLGTVRFIKSR